MYLISGQIYQANTFQLILCVTKNGNIHKSSLAFILALVSYPIMSMRGLLFTLMGTGSNPCLVIPNQWLQTMEPNPVMLLAATATEVKV